MRLAILALVPLALAGCARIHNHFQDDSPSMRMDWASPSGGDIYSRYDESPEARREWEEKPLYAPRGEVVHGPTYFEDPFVDKGSGREAHHIGWEDGVAVPYSLGRFLLNFVALPVSMVVTPPWTEMESDGVVSRQLLCYDHDATTRANAAREETHTPVEPGEQYLPPEKAEPEQHGGADQR